MKVSRIGRIANPTKIIILDEVNSWIKSNKNRTVKMEERMNNNPNTIEMVNALLCEW